MQSSSKASRRRTSGMTASDRSWTRSGADREQTAITIITSALRIAVASSASWGMRSGRSKTLDLAQKHPKP